MVQQSFPGRFWRSFGEGTDLASCRRLTGVEVQQKKEASLFAVGIQRL
jgi:hypothetical protein